MLETQDSEVNCMLFVESEKVELKLIPVDDIKKEVIAFANTGGGLLYIGVHIVGSGDRYGYT
jgi:ATP-dependent DNA helicase RecG